MNRKVSSLAVLADKTPFIPLTIRTVEHIALEDFQALDDAKEWTGRVDTDDLTILYYHQATAVLSKVGNVALKHSLKPSGFTIQSPDE